MYLQFPFAQEIVKELHGLYASKVKEKDEIDTTFLYGKWMQNSAEAPKKNVLKNISEQVKKAVENGKSPLADCHGTNQDVYAQIDDGVYFPQTEILEQIVNDHSNATFFLTFRNMERWYKSLQNWPVLKNGRGGFNMVERIQRSTITGGPSKSDPETFNEWYCKHVQRVRDLIAKNPSHTLVEIDIEDLDTAQRMEDIFGIRQSCWGHKNANALIHPELINATGIEFHWTTINH